MGGSASRSFNRGIILGLSWAGGAPERYGTSNLTLQPNGRMYRQGTMGPAAQPRSNGFASTPTSGMRQYGASNYAAQYGIRRYPPGSYALQSGGPPQAYGSYGTNIEVAQSSSEVMRPPKHHSTNYDY
jgi:hypothetical protein